MVLFLQVIFSDETWLYVLDNRGSFVWRRPGEEYDSCCVSPRVKHPTKVMVWSCISASGCGRIHAVEGTMNSEQYVKVIKSKLLPTIQDWTTEEHKEWIFMQDGASCHTSRKAKEFLVRSKLELLSWHGNSPDINPIENMWALLKTKTAMKGLTTTRAILESLIHTWHHDPEMATLCKTLVHRMPRRVAAVIKAHGGLTKY